MFPGSASHHFWKDRHRIDNLSEAESFLSESLLVLCDSCISWFHWQFKNMWKNVKMCVGLKFEGTYFFWWSDCKEAVAEGKLIWDLGPLFFSRHQIQWVKLNLLMQPSFVRVIPDASWLLSSFLIHLGNQEKTRRKQSVSLFVIHEVSLPHFMVWRGFWRCSRLEFRFYWRSYESSSYTCRCAHKFHDMIPSVISSSSWLSSEYRVKTFKRKK
jgi:hypothetical protein